MRSWTSLALLVTAAAVMTLAGPAQAAPQDVANDISQEIMSPFCPGVTLHDCPSDSAVALREQIRAWAESGFSRAQIMDKLFDEYGEATLRAEPPLEGSGLLAWLLPAAALVLAVGVAGTLMRRWARVPDVPDEDRDVHVTASDRHRIDSELAKVRGRA